MSYRRRPGGHELEQNRLAPRLYHGMRFCKTSPIPKKGLLSGKQTESGRSYILFSAARDKKSLGRNRGGKPYRNKSGNVEPYNSDNDNPTRFEACKFDREVMVTIDMHVAEMSGCKVFITGSFAVIEIRWTEVNAAI